MMNPQPRHLQQHPNNHHHQHQHQPLPPPPPQIRSGLNTQPVRMPIHNPSMPSFPPRASPPNLESDTKHVPCKFYPLGSCNAGDACKFSHNLETAQDRQPCRYFQKGNCKFGAKCALLHIIDGRLVNDPIGQNNALHPGGFQRQVVIGGPPSSQVSGLSMQLGGNQPPPPPAQPPTYSTPNGFGQQSYFPPTSPTMNDGNGPFGHNSPPSPPKYRSGLSSALRNYEIDPDMLPRSASSLDPLGPLDAQFPASVDLNNNHIARHGPFAASVPSKFGLPPASGISSFAGSVRDRVVTGDYPTSGTTTPLHNDNFGSRYGSPIDSVPWALPETFTRSGAGSLLQQSMHQSRNIPTSPLHSRPQSSSSPFIPFEHPKPPTTPPTSRLPQHLTKPRIAPISSSVPAAHFGEKSLFSPHPIEDDENLDTDVLPSSLHDEVLLPQELNRRSSTSHTPGLNRRSSAYDEFARSPPSGAVTPGSERGGVGGGGGGGGGAASLAGSSPGSSRMESLWAKIVDPEGNNQLDSTSTSSSRQRVASPLRNTVDPGIAGGQTRGVSTVKTVSGQAALKWAAGRTTDKLFPHHVGAAVGGSSGEVHGVNVPGVAWRRKMGEGVTIGRGELTNEEVNRIKEEEEGTQFSME